jgi:tyrosyl-tRNA synthetase
MDLYSELAWRGMVYDTTEGLQETLASERVTAYVGFDPTAASLHVGSLLPVMALARLQRCGHSPIALVGGGTGLIGDPSGKAVERTLLSAEKVETNVRGIRSQLERFLDFDPGPHAARLVDNAEWLGELSALAFMRAGSRAKTASPTPNSAICCCRPTTSTCSTIATAATCRWAAATSGATSLQAST